MAMQVQKRWHLSFPSLVGMYKLPTLCLAFNESGFPYAN